MTEQQSPPGCSLQGGRAGQEALSTYEEMNEARFSQEETTICLNRASTLGKKTGLQVKADEAL